MSLLSDAETRRRLRKLVDEICLVNPKMKNHKASLYNSIETGIDKAQRKVQAIDTAGNVWKTIRNLIPFL